MKDRGSDFVVNSKGHCFFCLTKISYKLANYATVAENRSPSSFNSLSSLQCLSQYLKLDMTRVFSQKGSIPESLLAKVKQSRLKVELCHECASLTKRFSVLFQQWEKIEMEMQSELSHIKDKLTMAKNLEGFAKSAENEGMEEVLKVLRIETLEKCSAQIDHPAPRVKIGRLTKKVVKRLPIRKTRNKEGFTPTINDAGFTFQTEDVKAETDNQHEDVSMDDEGDTGNPFMDNMGGISDDDTLEQPAAMNALTARDPSGNVNKEDSSHANDSVSAAPLTSANIEQNCSINPVTGKYKCNLCSREFGRMGFHYHYKNVHLKIRYKCNICEKIFSHQPSYKAHLRSVHLGVTFKCHLCTQEFKIKQSLKLHQRKNKCQAGNKLE